MPRRRHRSKSRSRPRSRCKLKQTSAHRPGGCNPPHRPEGWQDWLFYHEMPPSWWIQEHGLRMVFVLWLRILEYSSDGFCLVPAAAAAYLLPKENLTPELRTFFFNLLGAFVADLILVTLIKYFVCRAHTEVAAGVESWSFPSNHRGALMVVTFFTMYLRMWVEQAVIVWLPFLRRLLRNEVDILDDGLPMLSKMLVSVITWLVYSWALAKISSLIVLRRHFFFDVLVGCIVGVIQGTLYNSFLSIPPEVSEGVHNYIYSIFANSRDTAMKLFAGFWDTAVKLFDNGSFHVEDVNLR